MSAATEADMQTWSEFLNHCGSPEDFRAFIHAHDATVWDDAVEACAKEAEGWDSGTLIAKDIRALKRGGK